VLEQKAELFLPLHFLGDDGQAEIVGERDEVACDGAAAVVRGERFHERAR